MRYSVVKANIRHWREMYRGAANPERTMVHVVVRAYGYADDWQQRAEKAEAALTDARQRIAELEQAEQLTLVYEVLLRWVANMAARKSGVPEDAPPFVYGYWRAVFEDALAACAFVQAGCGTLGITEAMRRLGAEGVDPPPSATEAMAELREKFGHYFDAIEDVDEWVRQQRSGEDDPPTRP